MTMLHLQLPGDVEKRLRAQAAADGFGTIEEYAEALLRATTEEQDYGAPEHLIIRDEEDLKAKLKEGMNSPGRVLTPDDWAEKRRQLVERHRRVQQP